MREEYKSKFLIPKNEGKTIRRVRINKILEDNLKKYPITYIQAFHGVGKTRVVSDYMQRHKGQGATVIWYDCKEATKETFEELLEEVKRYKQGTFIVIDGFEEYIDTELEKKIIEFLMNHKFHKIVLMSTGKLPLSLCEYMGRGYIGLITGCELMYTASEMEKYACSFCGTHRIDLSDYPDTLPRIPLIMNIYLRYKENKKLTNLENANTGIMQINETLDHIMYNRWPEKIQQIVLKCALFPNITKTLLLEIFSDPSMYEALEKWDKKVCIIEKKDEHTYELSRFIKGYLVRLISVHLDEEELKRVIHIGCRYYIANNQYEVALELLEQIRDYEKLAELLCEYMHVCQLTQNITLTKYYYSVIPQKIIERNVVLLTWCCLHELSVFNYVKARKEYECIIQIRDGYEVDSIEYMEIVKYQLFLIIVMPAEDKTCIKELFEQYCGKIVLDSVTEYFLDIRASTTVYIKLLYHWNTIQKLKKHKELMWVKDMLGERLVAITEIYLGIFYYKQGEIEAAKVKLIKGSSRCRKYNMIDAQLMVSCVLGDYIGMNSTCTHVMIEDGEYSKSENYSYTMAKEYEAIKTSLKLMNNEVANIDKWWHENEKEMNCIYSIINMERYILMIRIAIYKRYFTRAQAWLELLLMYSKQFCMESYVVQLNLLMAELYYSKEQYGSMNRKIHQVMEMIRYNGYIMMIAKEGKAFLELLEVYLSYYPQFREDPLYITVRGEANKFAEKYPNYEVVSKFSGVKFTKSEIAMLYELATDQSLSEIADHLCVSLNTVKHHTKNIYSKMKVNKRALAVRLAKESGLI